jgi:hypothetical protein
MDRILGTLLPIPARLTAPRGSFLIAAYTSGGVSITVYTSATKLLALRHKVGWEAGKGVYDHRASFPPYSILFTSSCSRPTRHFCRPQNET